MSRRCPYLNEQIFGHSKTWYCCLNAKTVQPEIDCKDCRENLFVVAIPKKRFPKLRKPVRW